MKKTIASIVAACLVCFCLYAQDVEAARPVPAEKKFKFTGGVAVGVDIVPDHSSGAKTWTVFAFQPEFSVCGFQFAFDLGMRFRITPNGPVFMTLYKEDWIPNYNNSGKNAFDIYVPKILFMRYGKKDDPIYLQCGNIEGLTYGSGLIINNYANTCFLPSERLVGLDFTFDESALNFRYFGIQLMTSNLARLDVFGARLYTRPLALITKSAVRNISIGLSFAMDRGIQTYTSPVSFQPVMTYGADITIPVLDGPSYPLAFSADFGLQQNKLFGCSAGIRGRLASVFIYEAQLRVLTNGYMPDYFDTHYDIHRAQKADALHTGAGGSDKIKIGWLATLGVGFFNDALTCIVTMKGLAWPWPSQRSLVFSDYPHVHARFETKPELLGGFSMGIAYDKYFIGRDTLVCRDLIDISNSVFTASAHYKTSRALFSFLCSMRYNSDRPYTFVPSLKTTIYF